MEWFLVWIFCAVIAACIASAKGRSSAGWFVLGFFIGPFAFVVALLPSVDAVSQEYARRNGTAGGYRKCPYCAEAIRLEAVKCRYCQSDLTAPSTSVEQSSRGEDAPPASWALTQLPASQQQAADRYPQIVRMIAAAGYSTVKVPTGWDIITSTGRVVQTVETVEGLGTFAQMVQDKGVFWNTTA